MSYDQRLFSIEIEIEIEKKEKKKQIHFIWLQTVQFEVEAKISLVDYLFRNLPLFVDSNSIHRFPLDFNLSS